MIIDYSFKKVVGVLIVGHLYAYKCKSFYFLLSSGIGMKVLLSRKDTVKFLILSELMKRKDSSQRDIAKKLGITPQAVSEHFKELINEGLVKAVHRGYYEVTERGKEWLRENLFDLHSFAEDLIKKIYSDQVVAIAVGKIEEGDSVKFWIEDGYIYAKRDEEGNGVALISAEDGEDVLVKPTSGFELPKEKGEIIVVKVPDIVEGGSRRVNIEKLRELIWSRPKSIVVSVGIEALVTSRKAGVEPIFFGGKAVCVEAAHMGSGVIVLCVENMLDDLLRTLIDEDLKFDIKEL